MNANGTMQKPVRLGGHGNDASNETKSCAGQRINESIRGLKN